MSVRISVKVKLPKGFEAQKFVDAIARAQREKTAPALRALFEETINGWGDGPYFSQRQTISRDKISIRVFPGGQNAEKYALVSRGARAHIIRGRHGPLRFQPGYTPSTRPGSLNSRPKRRFGPSIRTFEVHHPGFEPRNFDQLVANAHEDQFAQDMQDAMKVY